MGNQAGLLGGLGNHGIADGQCRHDFADKNRQREVPRADGDNGADRRAFGTGGFDFVGIVAAEIDRFAHFGNGVVERFTRLAHRQHHQRGRMGFEQVGKTAQAFRPFRRPLGRPCLFRSFGGSNHIADRGRLNKGRRADYIAVVGGIAHGLRFAALNGHCGDGSRLNMLLRGGVHLVLQLLQYKFIAQIHALRIQTACSVQVARQRQRGVHFTLCLRGGIERAFD